MSGPVARVTSTGALPPPTGPIQGPAAAPLPRWTATFSTLTPGVVATVPGGLTLTRAASTYGTDYYRTSVSALGTAAANQARAAWTATGNGLLLETATTNLLKSTASMVSGWGAGNATLTAGQADPAGGTLGVRVNAASGHLSAYWTMSAAQAGVISTWYMRPASTNTVFQGDWNDTPLAGYYSIPATATWQQLAVYAATTNNPLWIVVDGRAVAPLSALASDVTVAFLMYTARSYTVSPIVSPSGVTGTRAADILSHGTPSSVIDATGRLALHAKMILQGTVSQLPAPPTLWYRDANYNVALTSTGAVTVTVNGSTYTTPGQIRAGAGAFEIFVAAGGGSLVTEVWISTDGGTTGQLIGKSSTAAAAIPTTGTLYLLGSSSTGQWDAVAQLLEAA